MPGGAEGRLTAHRPYTAPMKSALLAVLCATVAAGPLVACGGASAANGASVDGSTPDGAASSDAAMESSPGTPADATSDVLPDVTLDASANPPDGPSGGPADATGDSSRADAGDGGSASDAASATLLMTAITTAEPADAAADVDASAPTAFSAAYQAGAWSTLSAIGSDGAAGAMPGGGVAFVPSGHAVAALNGSSATWSGSWSALTPIGVDPLSVGAPLPSPSGALLAFQYEGGLVLGTFDDAASAWSSQQTDFDSYTQSGISCVPALVLDAQDDPVVLFSVNNGNASSQEYMWAEESAGTWTQPAYVPGQESVFNATPAVVARKRVGADQVVAVFVNGSSANGPEYTLGWSTFGAGVWSSPAELLASDAIGIASISQLSMAALPDGRVAFAYLAEGNAVKVGFFDGMAWSAFTAAPVSPLTTAPVMDQTPQVLSLTAGAAGAVLELAYIDASSSLAHTRLTDESTWTWTSPHVVDATHAYGFVAMALSP